MAQLPQHSPHTTHTHTHSHGHVQTEDNSRSDSCHSLLGALTGAAHQTGAPLDEGGPRPRLASPYGCAPHQLRVGRTSPAKRSDGGGWEQQHPCVAPAPHANGHLNAPHPTRGHAGFAEALRHRRWDPGTCWTAWVLQVVGRRREHRAAQAAAPSHDGAPGSDCRRLAAAEQRWNEARGSTCSQPPPSGWLCRASGDQTSPEGDATCSRHQVVPKCVPSNRLVTR